MAVTFVMAMALAAGAQGTVDTVDVAYEDLSQGRVGAAIVALEPADRADAASLINLAAAYSAQGRYAEARSVYERAAYAERYELETANGQWVDSRVLARQALARLDRSALESRMASAGQ